MEIIIFNNSNNRKTREKKLFSNNHIMKREMKNLS
jgi:hypothetical protein